MFEEVVTPESSKLTGTLRKKFRQDIERLRRGDVPPVKKIQKVYCTSFDSRIGRLYIASTEDGVTTTLGRGGSDYTASIVGAGIGVGLVTAHTLLKNHAAVLPAGSNITFGLTQPMMLTPVSTTARF